MNLKLHAILIVLLVSLSTSSILLLSLHSSQAGNIYIDQVSKRTGCENITGSEYLGENEDLIFHRIPFDLKFILAFLRSLFTGDRFAAETFEASADLMEQKLVALSYAIQGTSNKYFQTQLRVVIFIFQQMGEAIELMKYFKIIGTTDEYLVHCMIDLNIRLLQFFDKNGDIELQDSETTNQILRLKVYAEFWRQEFDLLQNVRYGVRQAFAKQEAWANTLLVNLLALDQLVDKTELVCSEAA